MHASRVGSEIVWWDPATLDLGREESIGLRQQRILEADEGGGVGIFLDATLLETVELFAGLAVQVLAVDDEEALVDVLVGLEERGGFEGG